MELPRFVAGAAFPRQVRVATTPGDLLRIFALRYEVYVEEHGRLVAKADHVRRQLRDRHDETAVHLSVDVAGELVACARLHLGGIPSGLAAPLGLWRFHGLPPAHVGFVSKFMVRRDHRGSTVAARMMRAVFLLAREQRTQALFCTTFPDLVALYERAGMAPYGSQYIDLDLGPHHAMVGLMDACDAPASMLMPADHGDRAVGRVEARVF